MTPFSKEQERERDKTIIQMRIQRFIEHWQPHHPSEAATFSAEFIQIVQQLHVDAHSRFLDTITDLSNRVVLAPRLIQKDPFE